MGGGTRARVKSRHETKGATQQACEDQAYTVFLAKSKEHFKSKEETYKGTPGFVKEKEFNNVDINVFGIKDLLGMEEDSLLFHECKQFLKRIASGHKIKSRKFLYKKGVDKGPGKGTRLLVKGKEGGWAPFEEGVVEIE